MSDPASIATEGDPVRRTRARAMVALAFCAAALAFSLGQQPPVGRVEGIVTLSENGRPLRGAQVYLHAQTSDGSWGRSRYATTDASGHFRFVRSVAGPYTILAYADAHRVHSQKITVDEGKTTTTALSMTRTAPEITLEENHRVFLPDEPLALSVRGYVDWRKPRGTDTVSYRLYRTTATSAMSRPGASRALAKMSPSYTEDGQEVLPPVPPTLLHPASGTAPHLASQAELPIREGDREGFYVKRLDFHKPGPGLYFVEARHGTQSAGTWLQVTSTAMIVKAAGREITTFTAHLRTGTPLAHSSIIAIDNGRVVARAKADGQGIARFTVPQRDAESDNQLMLVAAHGPNEAIYSPNTYGNEEHGRFRVHTYTDRPIYRPGQRILFKSIVRRTLELGVRYEVMQNAPVQVEVRDPTGERVMQEHHTTSATGSLDGGFSLGPEAPTGVYEMVSTVAGERHTHDIVVASYRKPEFQVTVTPARTRYVTGEPIEFRVHGQFYFGAPLAGAEVAYDSYRQRAWDTSDADSTDTEDQSSQEQDDAYGSNMYGESIGEGKVKLDQNGDAVIRCSSALPDDPDAPPLYNITLHTKVNDPSGRASFTTAKVKVSTGNLSVHVQADGFMAVPPGRPTSLMVAVVGTDGRPAPGVPVTLELAYERWRHNAYTPMPAGRISLVTDASGRASQSYTPTSKGELRIDASCRDTAGRIVRNRCSLWVTPETGGDMEAEYSDLSLLADRHRYQPGDTAQILVNTVRTGQTVLLTIEGNRVMAAFTVPIRSRSTLVRVPIKPEYGPNVQLAACYVFHQRMANSQIALRVAMPQHEVRVQVMPDRKAMPGGLPRYAPGDTIAYTIRTTDTHGRPMPSEVSLSVVDESIFALRKDDPNAILRTFYPHREAEVSTGTSFENEYMGDADKAEAQIVARKRFVDTAYWAPSVQTGSSGVARVRFRLPDNLTTWRATVVAHTPSTAVGYGAAKSVEAKDFLVRVDTPRYLTEGDQSRVLAALHNDTGAPLTALVRLHAPAVSIAGSNTQRVTIPAHGDVTTSWQVTCAAPGTARILVTAWTLRTSGMRQLTDGVDIPIIVRPHGRETMVTFAGEVGPSRPEQEVVRLSPNALPTYTRLTIRLTPTVAGSLAGAIEYLVGYPYGCTEQTMSRLMPTLLAHRLADKQPGILPDATRRKLPSMVRDGLARLYRFQHTSGAWGWWETDTDDTWMTAYVLTGLAEARDSGFSVSRVAMRRGINAAVKIARLAPNEDRPFLLYAIARAGGRQEAAAFRNTVKLAGLPAEGLAYLAMVNVVLGKSPASAMSALEAKTQVEGATLHWTGRNTWEPLAPTASALRALLAAEPASPRVNQAMRWLMRHRTGDCWGSTRETAQVLAALCDYLRAFPAASSVSGSVVVRVNGRQVASVPLTGTNKSEREVVLRVPTAMLRPEKNDVLLQRVGGLSPVFYSVEMRQMIHASTLPAIVSSGIRVSREVLRVVPGQIGRGAWSPQAEPTGDRLKTGDRVRVRLTIDAKRDLSYVLVEDRFPAGCEVTERGAVEDTEDWSYWWSSIDVRDDRVAFFVRNLTRGHHVIEYNLRAQTPGTYRALPASVQGMYATDVRAETAEDTITVSR